MFCLLQMPHQVKDAKKLDQLIMELNQLEWAPQDLAPHFGAWCRGRIGTEPCLCFLHTQFTTFNRKNNNKRFTMGMVSGAVGERAIGISWGLPIAVARILNEHPQNHCQTRQFPFQFLQSSGQTPPNPFAVDPPARSARPWERLEPVLLAALTTGEPLLLIGEIRHGQELPVGAVGSSSRLGLPFLQRFAHQLR